MRFTKEQAEFIRTECGYDFAHDTDLEIPREILLKINDRAGDIEGDEIPTDENEPWSKRCKLAVEIGDLIYETLCPRS